MNTQDPVRDRIEHAERMLHHARQEITRGNDDDAVEFLAAARRNIDRAEQAIKKTAPVVDLQRSKEAARAR